MRPVERVTQITLLNQSELIDVQLCSFRTFRKSQEKINSITVLRNTVTTNRLLLANVKR